MPQLTACNTDYTFKHNDVLLVQIAPDKTTTAYALAMFALPKMHDLPDDVVHGVLWFALQNELDLLLMVETIDEITFSFCLHNQTPIRKLTGFDELQEKFPVTVTSTGVIGDTQQQEMYVSFFRMAREDFKKEFAALLEGQAGALGID